MPKPDETPEKPLWELHPALKLDRRLLIQSFTTDEFIYLLSNNYFLKMDENNLLEEHFISESGNISLFDYPMLNEQLFAVGLDVYHLNQLEIFSTQNPEISTAIDLFAIDSTFEEINYFWGNGMCVNADNKLLFSVSKKYDPDVFDPYLYFWMFDFVLEQDHLTIEFDKEIKIEFPEVSNTYGVKSITEILVFDNEFYCSINTPTTTYKIDSEGAYEELFPLRDSRIFSKNDTLFALGHTREYEIGYAIKPPFGNSWETYSLGVFDGGSGKFYQVNGQFIMVKSNQFWELKISHSDQTFSFKEIDREGLPPISIRSLFEFKNKVYLVTPEGLFYKKLEDFFTYKEK